MLHRGQAAGLTTLRMKVHNHHELCVSSNRLFSNFYHLFSLSSICALESLQSDYSFS